MRDEQAAEAIVVRNKELYIRDVCPRLSFAKATQQERMEIGEENLRRESCFRGVLDKYTNTSSNTNNIRSSSSRERARDVPEDTVTKTAPPPPSARNSTDAATLAATAYSGGDIQPCKLCLRKLPTDVPFLTLKETLYATLGRYGWIQHVGIIGKTNQNSDIWCTELLCSRY